MGPPSRLLLHQLEMDLRLLSLLRWRFCCLSSGLCSSLSPSSPLPSPRPCRPWRYSCRRVFGRFSGLPCSPSSLPSSLLLPSSLPALLPCLLRLPSLLARNLLASSLGGEKGDLSCSCFYWCMCPPCERHSGRLDPKKHLPPWGFLSCYSGRRVLEWGRGEG